VFTIARKEWHWVAHNPLDEVSKYKEGSGRVRCLSDEERGALLASLAGYRTFAIATPTAQG
jgi:hypothetical protein